MLIIAANYPLRYLKIIIFTSFVAQNMILNSVVKDDWWIGAAAAHCKSK
jgi:hypothetical protein